MRGINMKYKDPQFRTKLARKLTQLLRLEADLRCVHNDLLEIKDNGVSEIADTELTVILEGFAKVSTKLQDCLRYRAIPNPGTQSTPQRK